MSFIKTAHLKAICWRLSSVILLEPQHMQSKCHSTRTTAHAVQMHALTKRCMFRDRDQPWWACRGSPSWRYPGWSSCSPRCVAPPQGLLPSAYYPLSLLAECCQSPGNGLVSWTHSRVTLAVGERWRKVGLRLQPSPRSWGGCGSAEGVRWWTHRQAGSLCPVLWQ